MWLHLAEGLLPAYDQPQPSEAATYQSAATPADVLALAGVREVWKARRSADSVRLALELLDPDSDAARLLQDVCRDAVLALPFGDQSQCRAVIQVTVEHNEDREDQPTTPLPGVLPPALSKQIFRCALTAKAICTAPLANLELPTVEPLAAAIAATISQHINTPPELQHAQRLTDTMTAAGVEMHRHHTKPTLLRVGDDNLCAISLGQEDEEFADTLRLAVALTSHVALLRAIRLRTIVIYITESEFDPSELLIHPFSQKIREAGELGGNTSHDQIRRAAIGLRKKAWKTASASLALRAAGRPVYTLTMQLTAHHHSIIAPAATVMPGAQADDEEELELNYEENDSAMEGVSRGVAVALGAAAVVGPRRCDGAAGVRALQRQHAPAAASAAHDAALAATARWSCAALVRRWTLPTSVWCLTPLRRSLPSMPFIRLLLPPARSTYSPSDEPPDLQRAPPSWGDNADEKDDPAAHEERGKSGEPLRVRPLGVGSVLERLASAHALGQVGADAREVMGPDGAVYMGAPISPYPEWMTGALGRRREAHTTLLERIASFGTSGYGCHHGAMRLLVVCAERQTGFLSRMMPPSEVGPFLEAVDAANISAAFSLLGLDAFDQSTPRLEAAIIQMSMPTDFGGMNLSLLQSEAPAAFYSAQSVVLPKLVRECGPALGPLYEAVRTEVSFVATSALPWARETRRVYETVRALTTLPQVDVRRARTAYGHAHEIFDSLTYVQ
eukprot:jgi/Tetstr1/456161/TSEL_042929.t1